LNEFSSSSSKSSISSNEEEKENDFIEDVPHHIELPNVENYQELLEYPYVRLQEKLYELCLS
jgi:hypothetical protein